MTMRVFSFVRFRRQALVDRARKGVTAVEMALIAPVFFLLMIGVVEISLIMTVQQLLENAAFNATRLAKTGYTTGGQTQQQTIQAVLNTEMQSLGQVIDPAKITMTSTAYADMSMAGAGTAGLGAAGQVVVYTISYPWKLFTPMMSALMGTGGFVTLSSHIVVQNEPY